MPDDNNEWAAAVSKALDAPRHELATNAFSLVRRDDRHRPERCADDGPDRQWAEHDVAHNHAIGDRDKRQEGGTSFAKGIDDSTLLLLSESPSVDFPDRVEITRLLVSYLNHVASRFNLGWSLLALCTLGHKPKDHRQFPEF